MFQQEQYDVEPKRRLKAGESAQIIFCILVFINSGYLIYISNCTHYRLVNFFLFFGSMIWFIFLLLTSVIQFKNKGTRALFGAANWIFLLFHFGIFIWANVRYWGEANTCQKNWDWWIFIYLIFGYISGFAIASVAFMWLLRSIGKRTHHHTHPAQKNIQHQQDYNELGNDTNVDFYEY